MGVAIFSLIHSLKYILLKYIYIMLSYHALFERDKAFFVWSYHSREVGVAVR